MDKTLSKKERENIFALFLRKRQMKFNEIEKELGVRSNHLSYHLAELIRDGVFEKEGENYKLTKEGEKLIPAFAHLTGKEEGPITIVASAVLNGGRICLLKRNKRPYMGYWSIPGGKLKLSESVRDAALREVKEETGLDCRFDKVSSVLHERVKDEGMMKHAFVIFLCKLATEQTELKVSDEGGLEWFELSDLPKEMIPSDRLMVEELLDGDFSCKTVILEDKDGKLGKMKVIP